MCSGLLPVGTAGLQARAPKSDPESYYDGVRRSIAWGVGIIATGSVAGMGSSCLVYRRAHKLIIGYSWWAFKGFGFFDRGYALERCMRLGDGWIGQAVRSAESF